MLLRTRLIEWHRSNKSKWSDLPGRCWKLRYNSSSFFPANSGKQTTLAFFLWQAGRTPAFWDLTDASYSSILHEVASAARLRLTVPPSLRDCDRQASGRGVASLYQSATLPGKENDNREYLRTVNKHRRLVYPGFALSTSETVSYTHLTLPTNREV